MTLFSKSKKPNAASLENSRMGILSSFLKVEEDLKSLAQQQEEYTEELYRQIEALEDEKDQVLSEKHLTQSLLKNFKKLLS